MAAEQKGALDETLDDMMRGDWPDTLKPDPDHPETKDCEDQECIQCGMRDCPDADPLHYHHDGCPSCSSKREFHPEGDTGEA